MKRVVDYRWHSNLFFHGPRLILVLELDPQFPNNGIGNSSRTIDRFKSILSPLLLKRLANFILGHPAHSLAERVESSNIYNLR